MNIEQELKNKSGIYKLESNNIIYIGSSINIFRRLKDHFRFLEKKKHQNPHLQNHYNKYGIESFTYSIIEFCNKDCLKEKETYYIEKYECFEKGFNQSKNSYSSLGYKHTEENKMIMSLKKTGHKQSEEQIEKRKASLIGKKRTEEHKQKYRNSKLGEKNPMFGKKEEDEHKKHRMKNMLSKERWNKGLTSKDDERLKKLAVWKNKIPPNAIKHILIDLETGFKWEEPSLTHLSKSCPLALSTLVRLKRGVCGKKLNKKYKLIW